MVPVLTVCVEWIPEENGRPPFLRGWPGRGQCV